MMRGRRVLGPLGSPSRAQLEGQGPPPVWRQILRLVFIGVVVLVVVLVLPVATYEKHAVDQQGAAPEAAVRAYCQAEVEQRYVDAWGLLSEDEQASWDRQPDQFVQGSQSADSKYGPVQSCRVLGRDFADGFGPDNAAFTVAVTRATGGAHQATIQLQPIGFERHWALSYVPPELGLPG